MPQLATATSPSVFTWMENPARMCANCVGDPVSVYALSSARADIG
jgi:hypothetical protein